MSVIYFQSLPVASSSKHTGNTLLQPFLPTEGSTCNHLWSFYTVKFIPAFFFPCHSYAIWFSTRAIYSSIKINFQMFNLVCACSVSQSCLTLRPHGLQSTRLLCPRNSLGKNIGAACHFPLQGIFLTQESNWHLLCLLNWQDNSLPLCHLDFS